MSRKYVPGVCQECGAFVDSRYECNACKYKWVPQTVEPKLCPNCHSPDWFKKDAKPYVKKGSRDRGPKGSKDSVDKTDDFADWGLTEAKPCAMLGSMPVQPKQEYFPESVHCEVCSDERSFLSHVEVLQEEGFVETLLCPVCSVVVGGDPPTGIQKEWLKDRGVVGRESWALKLQAIRSVDQIKKLLYEEFGDEVDLSLW